MPGPGFNENALDNLRRDVPDATQDLLRSVRENLGLGGALSFGDLQGLFGALGQERQGLNQQFGDQAFLPNQREQFLARQAAFQPLEGVQGILRNARTQAAAQAGARGFGGGGGGSTVSAVEQALASQNILQPMLAQAAGRESQLLLDVPFRNRQFQANFGLQSLGQGQQLAQQQVGLRQSVFAQLQGAIQQGSAERDFQVQQRGQGGGLGAALGRLGGAAVGSFLGPLGAQVGGQLGGAIFGGGGEQFSQSFPNSPDGGRGGVPFNG